MAARRYATGRRWRAAWAVGFTMAKSKNGPYFAICRNQSQGVSGGNICVMQILPRAPGNAVRGIDRLSGACPQIFKLDESRSQAASLTQNLPVADVGMALFGCAQARPLTIHVAAFRATQVGSPRSASAARTRGAAAACRAGFSRMILPRGPTFISTVVMASKLPLVTA